MSRAKKTNAAKRRSAIGLYRQIGEALNRADKAVGKKHSRLSYGDKQPAHTNQNTIKRKEQL